MGVCQSGSFESKRPYETKKVIVEEWEAYDGSRHSTEEEAKQHGLKVFIGHTFGKGLPAGQYPDSDSIADWIWENKKELLGLIS